MALMTHNTQQAHHNKHTKKHQEAATNTYRPVIVQAGKERPTSNAKA